MFKIGYYRTDRNHAASTMITLLRSEGIADRQMWEEGRGAETFDEMVQSIRPGDGVFVPALWMLAPDDRRTDAKRAMIDRVCQCQQAGAQVFEVLTGRDFLSHRHCAEAAIDAVEYMAARAKGRSSAANGQRSPGRPPAPVTDDEWKRAEIIWFSRHHSTVDEAVRAMQEQVNRAITKWTARHKFGPRETKK